MTVRPEDVFIVGGQPDETYIDRGDDRTIERWARPRVRPLLSVSGPTKSGKTVLLKKALPDAVWLQGAGLIDVDAFWQKVCDKLEVFNVHELEAQGGDSSTHDAQLHATTGVLGGNAGTSQTHDTSRRVTRARHESLASAGARALVAAGRVLVIDDFHYIPSEAQLDIVRSLKPMIFEGLAVVVAAVPHRAHDVVRIESEMTGRVQTLKVNDWDRDELLLIARSGFEILGVEDSEDKIAARLALESYGSPFLMQQHCRDICYENETASGALNSVLMPPAEWPEFFEASAEQAGKTVFDALKKGPPYSDRIPRQLKDERKTDIYGLVLASIEQTGPKSSLSYDDIREATKKILVGKLPEKNEFTNVLKQMSKIAKENIQGEPVLEWDEVREMLHITDPYFLYYLRWAPADSKALSKTRMSPRQPALYEDATDIADVELS